MTPTIVETVRERLLRRTFPTLVILAAALVSGGGAQASVTISSGETQNMTCFGGVCTPTASDAVLNTNDLQSLLATDNVKVVTTGSGVQANDIIVMAAVSWGTVNSLTLDAFRSIHVIAKVTAQGATSVSLLTNDGGSGGQLSFDGKGRVEFHHVTSKLAINGKPYKLVNTIHRLAALIAANPAGSFALAVNYDASRDGTYSDAPISTTFMGQLEGLGNALANLSIKGGTATGVLGLFANVNASGLVENLQLHVPRRRCQRNAYREHQLLRRRADWNHGGYDEQLPLLCRRHEQHGQCERRRFQWRTGRFEFRNDREK
jgi:hypothetical protein